MKGEIGIFVLRMVECMASSPETLRIPRMDSKLSEYAAHKILLSWTLSLSDFLDDIIDIRFLIANCCGPFPRLIESFRKTLIKRTCDGLQDDPILGSIGYQLCSAFNRELPAHFTRKAHLSIRQYRQYHRTHIPTSANYTHKRPLCGQKCAVLNERLPIGLRPLGLTSWTFPLMYDSWFHYSIDTGETQHTAIEKSPFAGLFSMACGRLILRFRRVP